MKNKGIFKRTLIMMLCIIFIFSSTLFTSETKAEITKSNIGIGQLAVVNFNPVWGDKETNVNNMINYINEAHEKGVKMILFPEMCVTGYASSSDPDSETYKMPVREAEKVDGPTAEKIASVADLYDMWIIYGSPEKIEGDDLHAYNSAFACSPEGEVTAYEKITPVEGDWCTPGNTPVEINTEWGLVGLSICYDTYATPELERYYSSLGCGLILNPTATSRSYYDTDGDGTPNDEGWEWYYKNRIESITSREGVLIASADLVGNDGPVGSDGKQIYNFPGGSVIIGGGFSGPIYYGGTTGDNDIVTGEEGIVTNKEEINMKNKPGSTTNVASDFHPDYYASWYKELADKKAKGESLSYYSDVSDGPTAAVVNCSATWGDKKANKEMMIKYIEEAAKKNVDILVFPETVLTGYSYEDPASDTLDSDKEMHVALAETIPGETTNELSEYAKKYGMYIVFGMSELDKNGPMYETAEYLDNKVVEKVYNSAAILYPDGKIESYQKMHRAGLESIWSVCGNKPCMIDTKWGKIGVDICRDGHFYPELGRYYAANGCTILIHPTATTGGPWYRENRIGSYTDRDGLAAITCNLLGPDGIYDAKTDSYSGGIFNSTSLIITKYINSNGRTGFDPITGSAISLNGTGSESEGYAERGTSPQGLEVAKMNLTGTGFRINNFNPLLFAKMYDKLAKENIEGYTSIFPGEKVNEASSIDLVTTDEKTGIQVVGKVPEGTTLNVGETDKNKDYSAYTFKLMKDGKEYTDFENVTVKIPASYIEMNKDFKVYKTDEKGKNLEISYIIKDGYIIFETNSLGELKIGNIVETQKEEEKPNVENTDVVSENKEPVTTENTNAASKNKTDKNKEKAAKTGDNEIMIYAVLLLMMFMILKKEKVVEK